MKSLRVVFVAKNNYIFQPPKVYGEGVGGAEYALIFLAKALAAQGHRVKIANNPGQLAGVYDGVEYQNIESWNPYEGCDVAVVWRNTYWEKPIVCDRLVLFSCDQITDSMWNRLYDRLDRFICISEYHRNYILQHEAVPRANIRVVELAANWPDYEQPTVAKKRNRMIWCTVPDRGLGELMRLWPRIREEVPDAELVVTSDYTLWGSPWPGNEKYLPRAKELESIGVRYFGKIPRADLVMLQQSSEIMPLPNIYEECFCVAAAECMAAGCVPVSSMIGALATTIGNRGILIPGHPGGDGWRDETFISAVKHLVEHPDIRQEYAERGRAKARDYFNFDAMAERFVAAVGD